MFISSLVSHLKGAFIPLVLSGQLSSVSPRGQIISQTTFGNDNQCSQLSAGATLTY